jgi:hypothetical protein
MTSKLELFSAAGDDLWQQPAVVNMGAWQSDDALARLRSALARVVQTSRETLSHNPLESLLALVFGGAALFYVAERGRNDKVQHFWDALDFVATCASVGYSNIFPTTPLGRIVASTLFLFGPNLTSRVLDPVGEARPASDNFDHEALATRLDAILCELRRLNTSQDHHPAGSGTVGQ